MASAVSYFSENFGIPHLGRALLAASGRKATIPVFPPRLRPVSLEQQQALFQAAATTSPDIQPGEKIRVTVYGEDRLSGEYEVDPGGYVSLPLAGTIKAAGLSKPQLEQALAKKFRGEYLKNPKVTVDVSTFRPFYILGEVGKPGEYPFKSGLNVMSGIA